MSVSFPFLQVAFDRFAPPELMDFVRRWKMDLEEVESLKRTSAMIQDLFDEAEVKQFNSVAIKSWLDYLKQLLYDAENILDEYATELVRLKLESEYPEMTHPQQTQQVRNPLHLTPSESSSVSSLFKSIIKSVVKGSYNITEKVQELIRRFGSQVRDIDERLNTVAQKGVALGLNSRMGSGSSKHSVFSQRPPTSSLVNKSKVVGREEDMWKIIDWLLSDKTPNPSNPNFSVLPIVGMGGVGKTTLAQLVYNHETVEKRFDLKAWVCVSEEFDVVRLTKELLESATGSSTSSNSLDALHKELIKALSRKRFLFVLDDMWDEDYERWEALSTAFAYGKPGSKVLVTTRNKGVSSIVGTLPNDHGHILKTLSDESCYELFRRHAFTDGNSSDTNRKLEIFGQEIVKKCKGLPLVAKTLAGLLRVKRESSAWKDILDDEIWDLREGKILPSLILSYHHLPPILKRCFAYCALFPKDSVFNKIELVIMWMAEGIVQPKGRKRPEDIGAEYFDELFMRSFFELSDRSPSSCGSPYVKPNAYYGDENLFYHLANKFHTMSFFESSSETGSGFVMHDLIHDLAQFVSAGIYCRRENDKPCEFFTTTRHLSYLTSNRNVDVTESEAMKNLRTILYLKYYWDSSSWILPTMQFRFQFLRVLRFRRFPYCVLPDSIGELKLLRLLDLSFSGNIERLPDSISSLYNLQTLVLTGCWSLGELPDDMGNLVNLRHLFLPECLPSSGMPSGVGTFTSLQTLNTLVVGSKNNSKLRELSEQLRGSLYISDLKNVGNISGTEEAMVANLKNKPHLFGLRLRWSDCWRKDGMNDLRRDEKAEEDVLDQLQPHTNLKALCIEDYGGTRFPSWIGHPSFSNLETVRIIDCCNCRFLPHLNQLPFLKHLSILRCSAVNIVGSELYGDGSSLSSATKQFRSLETLFLRDMCEWEEWPQVVEEEEGGGQFPSLRKLIITCCRKLRMFSHRFPVLVELKIEHCDDLSELPGLLPSLQWLSISECPKLVVLPSLPSIERLELFTCDQMITFSSSPPPSSSSSSAPRVDNAFPYLRELEIRSCPSLREITSILPSLESLKIRDCKELCFLPMLPSVKELLLEECKGMVLNNRTVPCLSSLSSLIIDDVSDLESLPNQFMQQLTTLQELYIYRCRELTVLLQNEIGSDLLPSSLQHLHIRQCDSLRKLTQSMCNLHRLQELKIEEAGGLSSLPEGVQNLTSLQVLQISDCENLESLPKELHTLTSLHEFVISSCPALVSFQEIRLPTALQQLIITDCKNLESLPNELHNLTSLQEFRIKGCPALVSFPKTGLPTGLQELMIKDCKNLESLPNELHNLTSLQQFRIEGCPALVSFPKTGLPTGLQELMIKDCKNLESLPNELHNLTSLQQFRIEGCPALVSFPKTGLPTGLQVLMIRDCKNMESLPIGLLHNLTSLQSLALCGFPNLKSLPEGLHKLTSLQRLEIEECSSLMDCKNQEALLYWGLHNLTSLSYLEFGKFPALKSIPKGMLPANLRYLEIKDCIILESLHDGLSDLTSLEELHIWNCPMLTPQYLQQKGEEWSKIPQIPTVLIDGLFEIVDRKLQ